MTNFMEIVLSEEQSRELNTNEMCMLIDVSPSLYVKYRKGESVPKYHRAVDIFDKLGYKLTIDYGDGVEDFDYEKFLHFIADNIADYGLPKLSVMTGLSTATLNRTRYKDDVNLSIRSIFALAKGLKVNVDIVKVNDSKTA